MRKFSESDYQQVHEWFQRRNMKTPSVSMLPKTGFIIDGIAVGFLIKTDTEVGILDFFCSNPLVDTLNRLEALDEIAFGLSLHAKQCGIKQLICTTRFENIKQIASKQGFHYAGDFSTFFKELC